MTQNDYQSPAWQIWAVVIVAIIAIVIVMCRPVQGAAIQELNAQRANLGLPPCVEDPQLTYWAQQKAEFQAAYHIRLDRGYNGHEGPQYPSWVKEGTGQVTPEWGWATCRMRTRGVQHVGCGLALGADGRRYMCLLIDGRRGRLTESNVRASLIDTSHLTPDAPLIPRQRPDKPREPKGPHVPIKYQALGPPRVHDRARSRPETPVKRARVLISTTEAPPIPDVVPIPYTVALVDRTLPPPQTGAPPERLTYPPSTPNTVVMFTTGGCAPCARFKRDEAPKLRAAGVRVIVQDKPPAGLGIRSFPSYMVSGDPKIYTGFRPAAALRERLKQARARRG